MNEKKMQTIWKVPKYLPYVQPKLTDIALANAEESIGYKLPEKYVDLLKIQNGGYIRFTIANTPHAQIYGIGPYFPNIIDFDWTDYIETVSFELNGLIPFDGDGHWYLCFDYRKNKSDPEITYIDTESDTDNMIAENFEKYINLLEIDTENEYVIEADLPIEQIVNEISRVTKIRFEPPDDFAHGYPIYRGNQNGNWVWISPNEVPKGFIREGEDRYATLKSEMEGTALRYPEIPGSALLINVSDDREKEKLFNTLKQHSFNINSLKSLL